jgi:hypothetical protein
VLELIDEGLEAFYRATVPLSANDVDVSFYAPDREWSAKLTRPTVNVFLWDIRRSTNSRSGVRTIDVGGQTVHQYALPIVELRYVVTAWTSDLGDERGLLAGVIRALLAHGAIPREYLPEQLAPLEIPKLAMARAGEDHMDVFKALEGQLKPGLNMVLTSEFDTGFAIPAGPPVEGIGTSIGRMGDGPAAPEQRRRIAGEVVGAEQRGAVGTVVRSPGDATFVNPRGQFLLRASAGDEIVLETDPPMVATVPATGGIRFE